jgi:hypothetical protein
MGNQISRAINEINQIFFLINGDVIFLPLKVGSVQKSTTTHVTE